MATATKQVGRIRADLIDRADSAARAAGVSRAKYIEGALEAALGNRGGPPPGREPLDEAPTAPAVEMHGRAPAPPRAPTTTNGQARRCSRCGAAITSPSLRSHPPCGGGKVEPPPKGA